MALAELVSDFVNYFLSVIVPRTTDMILVTVKKTETLEILIPLAVTMFLVQIYFGRNKNEQIGWNTAYANAIVLLFVTAHLASYVYNQFGLEGFYSTGTVAFYKSVFVIGIGAVAIGLLFIDFFHSVNKKISFLLSHSIFITVISFVAIVLVYTDIPFDMDTLFTSLFILLFVSTFFWLFRWFIPPSETAEKYVNRKKEERRRNAELVIARTKYKARETKRKILEYIENIKGSNKSF